jgi:hypothetical protein
MLLIIPYLVEILHIVGYDGRRRYASVNLAYYAHPAAVVILGLSVLMLFSLFKVGQYGRRLREQRKKQKKHDQDTLATHQRWVRILFGVTLAAVLVIEPTFRIFHLPYTLFFKWIHAPLFVCYAFSFIMARWHNGLPENQSPQYPERHNQLGKNTLFFGAMTVFTGAWLTITLLWLPF